MKGPILDFNLYSQSTCVKMSTKDRRIKEKENRKEDILKAAEGIMTRLGLHSLSMEAIAEETQLAKGTIYLYFKSKEEIVASLTIAARIKLLNEFQIIENLSLNPLEKLISIIKMNYHFYKEYPLQYDLVSLYEANHKVMESEEMYKYSLDITNLVCRIVVDAQEQGYIKKDFNPLELTMSIWGMTVGILQLLKVRGSIMNEKQDISQESLMNTYLKFFASGLGK